MTTLPHLTKMTMDGLPIIGGRNEAEYLRDVIEDPMCVSDGKPATLDSQIGQPMFVNPIPLSRLLDEVSEIGE